MYIYIYIYIEREIYNTVSFHSIQPALPNIDVVPVSKGHGQLSKVQSGSMGQSNPLRRESFELSKGVFEVKVGTGDKRWF